MGYFSNHEKYGFDLGESVGDLDFGEDSRCRFALDIDLDAPKVRIPLRAAGSSKCSSHFLLDFGNFTLTTMDTREEPNEFKPERFLGSGKEDEREYGLKYIPFGSGRRGCPGVNLAYILVGTAIGVMAQCFDWKIKGDKVNMEEARGALVLTMAHPLKCIPVARAPY